jgi:hypothetical protein
MIGRKHRQEELNAEVAAETEAALEATETDDSSIDPDEQLEAEEEPDGAGTEAG